MIIYSDYHKPFLRKTQEIIALFLCFFKILATKNAETMQHTPTAIGISCRAAFSPMPNEPMMSLGPFIFWDTFH